MTRIRALKGHSTQSTGPRFTRKERKPRVHKGLSAPHYLQLQSTQLAVRLCWACACPFDPSATHMRWASTPTPQGRPRRPAPGAGLGGRRALPAHSVLTLSAWGECRLPDPFASRRCRTNLPRPTRRAGSGARGGGPAVGRQSLASRALSASEGLPCSATLAVGRRPVACRRPATRRRGGPPSRPVYPPCGKAFDDRLCNHATRRARRINTVRTRLHKAARLSRGSPGAARAAVRAVGAGRASERARSSVGRAEPRRHCGGGGRSVCP